ncbi:MAG: hypothetical protein ACYC7E_17235 [Armatimonadota bacterium]
MRALGFVLRWLPALLGGALALGAQAAETPAQPKIDYTGPQVWYMPDLNRYRTFDPQADLTVPRQAVTRKTYVDFVRSQAAQFLTGPDHGCYGPRHVLPALAVYAYEGGPVLGEGIKKTLWHYAKWVHKDIEKVQGVFSEEGAYLCEFAFRELRKHKQMTPEDETRAKELLLALREFQCAWSPGDGYWRGQHHRSQAQGLNHALAAAFYPNEPEAAKWKKYAADVWGDWWNFRDVGCNDVGYHAGIVSHIVSLAELLDRKEVFTDPDVQQYLWNRLLHEVSPDGAVIPYGAHGGYNSSAGNRIYALELAAKYTRDGRYRWVAHRLMNFAQARGMADAHNHLQAVNLESVALTSLICDDTVQPVEPKEGSQLILRKEIIRLTDAQAKKMFPDAGGVDCNMYMTQKVMPSKLVFRSGWQPGDLFMMVECYPRHDPLNPTAIIGLEQKSSAMAMMTSEKFVSRENAVRIEDLSGEATYLGQKDWKEAKEPPTGYDGMEVTVPEFSDHAVASHAVVHVTNYLGFNAAQDREFFFVKNRFIVVRDETTFGDRFTARVGPTWNTQNIGPVSGAHWINTWFSAHWFQNLRIYTNPPWELLVYHAPKEDRRLIVDNRLDEKNACDVPYSTRYAWEGKVAPGARVQFVSVLLPHAPTPKPDLLAAGIEVLHDEPGAAAVAVRDNSHYALVILNRGGEPFSLEIKGDKKKPVPFAVVETDARQLYLLAPSRPVDPGEDHLGAVQQVVLIGGTYLILDDEEIIRLDKRGTFEK